MGTLVTNKKPVTRSTPDEDEKASKARKKTDKRIEKEYARIRFNFEDVRQAFAYVDAAQSHDDIYFRLLQLEKATRRLRTGGAFSRGAKLHRRLLRSRKKMSID